MCSCKQLSSSALWPISYTGSERNASSGSTGATLTEACAINKSLTTLGRVITELHARQRGARSQNRQGDEGCGERPPAHVPYRDSRLTYLLQVRQGHR